jgi:cellobiose phosphorylase
MQFGHFDAARREYVIDRPDTPRPWSNYLGSRDYGGIITNHAGGYSFTRSPAEGRILRFRYNASPLDQGGRYFYLRDRDSGVFWSNAWQPVGTPLDRYRSTCRFGTGYAVIGSACEQIETETTYLIPLGRRFEIWSMRVTNTDSKSRRIDVTSFCEFTNEWNLVNDLLNLQYSQFIGQARWEDGFVSASSCARLPQDPGNFANRDQSRWWWMTQLGGEVVGHDCDRDAFLGVYEGMSRPLAVQRGTCGNSVGFSDNLCGAIQSRLTLAPGESRHVVVLLGIGEAHVEGAKTRAEFASPEAVEREVGRLRSHWHALLDRQQSRTPDADLDHMVNVWNAYGAMMTFEYSRSFSTVYTGDQRDGFGYRDTVQDLLGVTPLVPELVRDRAILMISGQDSTGGAQPEVRPWLHTPGSMKPTPPGHYRSDDSQWLFNAIPAYLAETGDMALLDCVVPYADAGEASVLGHLRRALEFNLERTGKHGLPCGLLADWNDCLKLGYHGESVFVAFQLRLGLKTYADLCDRVGKPDESTWARGQLAKLDDAIQRTCWDGRWFIWAIGEDGTVYGSHRQREGQIYLNTQVWAVISGAASDAQARSCLDAVRTRLATEWGIEICDPPFDQTSVSVMRAVLFNPSNKENGGIFSHTQSWAVIAEAMRGNGDQAYAYYRAFNPASQNDRADVRQIEPFAHCQSTQGRHSPRFGQSRLPWLSGTVSWSYYTATQWILGIRPELEGLRIDPCIPRAWDGFRVDRLFRSKRLSIEVANPGHISRGIKALDVDGQEIAGNVIDPAILRDGSTVRALMG